MSGSESMVPEAERRRVGVAQRVLDLVDSHPMVKLLVLIWVAAASVVGPLYVWQKDRDEARRQGVLQPPAVEIGTAGVDCTVANVGRRPVVEATIIWRTYHLNVSACAVTGMHAGSHDRSPDASAKEVPPRDVLTAKYDDLTAKCRNARAPLGCGVSDDCRIVVECQARYHRMADLEEYTKSEYSLSTADCTQLRGLRTLYSYRADKNGDRVIWHDPSDERAYRCFSQGRARADQLLTVGAGLTHRAEELALGKTR
jgi:hypothetical protein